MEPLLPTPERSGRHSSSTISPNKKYRTPISSHLTDVSGHALRLGKLKILKKLNKNHGLRDNALRYWTRPKQEPQINEPTSEVIKWREEHIIKDVFAKRGQINYVSKGGHTVYKGENITAARFSGNPVYEKFDVSKASSPSVWAYQHILPPTMYAIPVIEQVPVRARRHSTHELLRSKTQWSSLAREVP